MLRRASTKKHYVINAIFMSVMTILIVSAFIWLAKDVLAAYKSKVWATTEGTIIYSKSIRGCGKGASYYPRIVYNYTIGANEFTNSRVAFGSICGSESDIEKITNQFKVNSSTSVHYDIRNPAESVLIAGEVLTDTWVGVALTSIFSIVSIFFLMKAIRELREIYLNS